MWDILNGSMPQKRDVLYPLKKKGLTMVERYEKGRRVQDRFHDQLPRNKVIWTFFIAGARKLLFEKVARALTSSMLDVDIAIVSERLRGISVTGESSEELMARRSDIVFVDIDYGEDENHSFTFSLIGRIIWDHGLNSIFVFCANSKDHNALLQQTYESPYIFVGSSERELKRDIRMLPESNVFVIPSGDDSSAVDTLVSLIQTSTARFYERKTFLCHASEDRQFSGRLAEELAKRGIPVWYDEWSLRVGDSLVERINEGIRQSKYMGVVLSHNSVNKPWCVKEMNVGLQRHLMQKGVSILPIVIDDCEIPPLFTDLLWADFRGQFEKGFDQIIKALTSA